ncbi:MAG: NAD(P)-dependent methylenetetrahydromethanopterin dehydrogenase [Planctomycetales bacterium]
MQRILLHLDTDPLPSSFDRIVAIDAGADRVLSYGGVAPENVEPLVHGAIFTRAPDELRHTAIFIGGSDAAAGEALFEKVRGTFFGPLRVSVMLDSNGSNTTAAAAVLAAAKHMELSGAEALVLGGTGPVGQRAAQLLARQGAKVRLASRSIDRAQAACERIAEFVRSSPGAAPPRITPCENGDPGALEGVALIVAAGAPGVELLSAEELRSIETLQVAIDLNALPPAGLAGIAATDKAQDEGRVVRYGAIGVGGAKMKIHRAAIKKLFKSNDRLLDAEAIFEIGERL